MSGKMYGFEKGQEVRVITSRSNFKNRVGEVSDFREDAEAVAIDFKNPGFQKIWFVPSELESV